MKFHQKVIKKCPSCGKEMILLWSRRQRKYCSNKCYGKAITGLKGKKMSKESRKKLSESAKKIKNHTGRFKKGHRINIGRKLSDDKKRERSKRMTGKKRPDLTGNKNPRWLGGLTSESERIRKSIEYRSWRDRVFRRDEYTCQRCQRVGNKLRAHHIQNFASSIKLRTSLKNGITLCKLCHHNFHNVYGIKNNNEEQIKDFIA